MKKRLTALFIIATICCPLLFAETLTNYIPGLTEQEQEQLLSGTMLTMTSGAGDSVARLVPSGSFSEEIANNADNRSQGFAVVTLKYIPFTESLKNQSQEERQLFLFNTLRSISTQKGLTYISHLAGEKEITLIEDTYLISDRNDKKSRIDDPVSEQVEQECVCYSYQKDNRFGSNVYELNYKTTDNEIFLKITNYTKMKYLGFTCLSSGELHMFMDVVQAEEGFILYSIAESENRKPTVDVLFISVDLPSSFSKRISALGSWFERKVSETN